MAGLTTTGLTIETIETLLASIVADQLANIDASLNTEADSLVGQLNAIYAAALLELWELLEEIYQSGFADTASGQSLTYLAAITGTIREPATRGTVTATFAGTAAAAVPAGTEFYAVGRPETSYFRTIAADVIGGGGTVDIACEAVTPGSDQYVLSGGGANFVLPNPPSGVTGVSVSTDSVLGQDEESDADLRTRREAELGRPGSATVEAIRADLLEVLGVDAAQVFENVTDVTDVNGLPPHSIECLVYSETAPAYAAQDIVDAIWAAKPAGTATYGSLSRTVTDSAGDSHTVYYSEPLEIDTYVEVTLTYDLNSDYTDQAVKDAILLWGQTLSMGDDVYASDIIAVVTEVDGVLSVDGTATQADDVTPTVNYDLTISNRQVAKFADARITVSSTGV